ncbi:hypothetical protein LCGC14_1745960 [marine sediment metagenome]|uniref:Uncharacterized protein n=1 Tax=marine sediment metagenome TaxID=412755 RepID=A0A0F9HSR4_9ZZZZ
MTVTKHRPAIETIINTVAIALTASGTAMLLETKSFGFALIGFGVLLEFFKYWGRREEYW